ncbi:DUF2142 domain-containing protein [Dactylosporangium sp. NPDC005555]|uniref:DUF2142 domain-containing protein n=1 Tax=Dactylosporangium sp. NPDC005555 TaxID=3154889 RepID=UPI0033BA21A8
MRRAFLIAFVGFFLLGAAWALALPANGTYDEKQHLVRAWAVWTGQWLPHDRALDASGNDTNAFTGPRSLLPADADCTWIDKPAYKPASCLTFTDDRSSVLVPSAAARYSPVYYALVGLPLRISPTNSGLIWSRLLSAALSALLLASAFALAGTGLLRAAVVLAATPMLLDLAGAINPNGLEISAAVLLYVAVLRKHWPAAGVAAALLITTRDLGPFFAAAVLAVALLVTRSWPRSRALWLPAAGGLAFAAFWTLVASRTDAVDPGRDIAATTSGAILRDIADNRAEFWVRQIVGQFGYGETTVSIGMIGLWYLLVALLVVPALWFGPAALRIGILAAALGSVVLLVALELYFAPKVGHFAHGRYVMPLGVGVVLLAGFTDRYAAWLTARRWLLGLILVTVPLHIYALARVMTRFQRGINEGLNPIGGTWQPPLGSVLPLLACLVGGALLAVIVTRSSVRPTPVHSTANTLSN